MPAISQLYLPIDHASVLPSGEPKNIGQQRMKCDQIHKYDCNVDKWND